MRVLFLGEIVGIPAVRQLCKKLYGLRSAYKADFVIANADGGSDGYGLLAETASDLLDAGIDVLTSGDLVFNKKNIKEFIDDTNQLLRPLNLADRSPGQGMGVFTTTSGAKVGVASILGRTNFTKIYANDPYKALEHAIHFFKPQTNCMIIDFHGGTTSEIQGMHWMAGGLVSAVIGTNLRVLTADNRVIEGRTAVLTGSGICAGKESIGGFDPAIEIKKMVTGRFFYSKITKEEITVEGCVIDIDDITGDAVSINLLREKL